MDSISLKCSQCGATMSYDPDTSEAVCEYCGHKMIIEREESGAESQKLKDKEKDSIQGKDRIREKDRTQEKDRIKEKNKIKRMVIPICFFLLLGCVVFFYKQLSVPKINPFDYMEIAFSGVDGDGKAVVQTYNGKDDVDVSALKYEVSPSDHLSEGDYVTVHVSSPDNKYRLTSASQKYKVEGLEKYLTDLSVLEDEQIQIIYDKNKEIQENNFSTIYSDVQVSEFTPLRICLMTDGNKNSKLFVVSKISCTKDNLTKIHYVVSQMDDVIEANGNISMGFTCYNGNLTGSISENGGGFIFAYASLDAALADIKSSDASLTYSELTP